MGATVSGGAKNTPINYIHENIKCELCENVKIFVIELNDEPH